MTKKKTTTDAVKILYNRYVKNDPTIKKSLKRERQKSKVVRWVYNTFNVDIMEFEDDMNLKAACAAMKKYGPEDSWLKIKEEIGL